MGLPVEPEQMWPVMPEKDELEERAVELIRERGRLGGELHPVTRGQVRDLVRPLNSHYSNRIEGHDTHLKEIQEALAEDYSSEPDKHEKQQLAVAHIHVQKQMEDEIQAGNNPPVTSAEFLKWIHREFYEQIPESMCRVKNPKTGEQKKVKPGNLRSESDEVVGARHHMGVDPGAVKSFLDKFHSVYDPAEKSPLKKVYVFAASHHRLLWIHPFLDGNGRVARPFSHAYTIESEIDAGGLWSLSRGFARYIDDYQRALSWADQPRQNDTDGRGPLYRRGLNQFCQFMLDVVLDQLHYMKAILDLEDLEKRIRGFVRKASEGLAPEVDEIKIEAQKLLVELLYHGEIPRGDAPDFLGMKPRTARRLVKKLQDNNLVTSETPRGPLRLAFPEVAVRDYFPDLYSHDTASLDQDEPAPPELEL